MHSITTDDVIKPLTEQEETRRGQVLVSLLNLKESKIQDANSKRGRSYDPPRYSTAYGTKTALGLFRTLASVVIDGK